MMKKSLAVVVTTGMVLSACAVGFTACDGNEGFSAPENVSVAGSVLSWDAVGGASEGYTVRVGADDAKTVSVSATDADRVTLSLAEGKIVEYFVTGANELSVKVNAAAGKTESAYSAAVTYTYTPASPVKTPLNTPSGLKVEGDELSWEGVTGATEGYTVKINEGTLQAEGTSLDLTSESVKALLVRGENTLSVKANGTDAALESAYSSEVKYTYVIATEVEADEFKTAVGAIDVSALSEETANKLAAAKAKYNALSQEAKELSSEAIASLKSKDAAYYGLLADAVGTVDEESDKAAIDGAEAALAAAKAYTVLDGVDVAEKSGELAQKEAALTALKNKIALQLSEFEEKVNAAVQAKTEEQSVSALETAVNAAKEAVLCNAAKSAEADRINALQESLTQCETALSNWRAEIQAAASALAYDFTGDDEAIYQKATELLEVYAGYSGYIKADTEIAARYEAIVAAQTTAKGNIDGVVSELKSKTEGLSDTTALSKSYYDELIALKERIEALVSGEYGASQWNAEDTLKVTNEIVRTETTAVAQKDDVQVFLSGANGTVTVLYEAYNVLGNAIETAPALALTLDAATSSPDNVAFVKGDNGVYRYVAPFTVKGADSAYALKVTYSIGGGEAKTVTYNFENDRWFIPDDFLAIKEGKINYSGVSDDETFFDVYETGSIALGENGGIPVVTGFPLIKGVPVTNGMTLEEFRRTLARNYADLIDQEYEVQFVVYRKSETDGIVTVSNVKNDSVSRDTYTLDLTEADTKEMLPLALANGKWDLGDKTGVVNYRWEVVTEQAELHDGVNVYAYLVGEKDVQTYDFVANDTPFAVYTHREAGYINWSYLDEAIMNAWKALEVKETNCEFVFVMQSVANETALAQGYVNSVAVYATNGAGERDTKTYPMTFAITNNIVDAGIWDNGDFTLISGDETVIAEWLAQFNGITGDTLTAANASDYFEIVVSAYGATDDVLLYSKAVPFVNRGFNYNTMLKLWTKQYFAEHADETQKSFSFYMTLSINLKEEKTALKAFFPEASAAVNVQNKTVKEVILLASDLVAPTEIQLNFTAANGGNFEFLRTAGGNGSVFAIGVKCVEVKFEKDGVAYSAFIFAEDGRLNMYVDQNKSGTACPLDTVANGWLGVNTFNAWVRANYTSGGYFDFSEWEFSTRVISDGTFYIGDGSYSEKTTWAKDTNSAEVPVDDNQPVKPTE